MVINPDHVKAVQQEYERRLARIQLEQEYRKAAANVIKSPPKPARRSARLMARLAALFRHNLAPRQPDRPRPILPSEK